VPNDLRYSLRYIRKHAVESAAVVLSFALGIGASASVLSTVDSLLFRPPPRVLNPESVKRIYFRRLGATVEQTGSATSYPLYLEFARRSHSLTAIAAMSSARTLVIGIAAMGNLGVVRPVTHSYFPLLGLRPALGHFFGAEDDRAGAEPTAVVSYDFWRSRMAGDKSVLGRTLRIGTDVYVVIGVAPKDFHGLDPTPEDVWLPLGRAGNLIGPDAILGSRTSLWLSLIGRLRPTVTPNAAERELTQVFNAVGREDAEPNVGSTSVVLAPIQAARGPSAARDRAIFEWLLLLAGVVLLIVCANVGSITIAQLRHKRRDMALQLALGARSRHLLKRACVQTLVLSLIGGIGALIAQVWLTPLLQDQLSGAPILAPRILDSRTLAATGAIALFAGVLASLTPVLIVKGTNVAAMLTADSRSTWPYNGVGSTFIVIQVSLTLILLAIAALFIQSQRNIRADLGFAPARIIVATMDELRQSGRSPTDVNAVFLRMLARLKTLPGVEDAAASAGHPFGWSFGIHVSVPGRSSLPKLSSGGPYLYAVTPDFFHVLGAPLLRGQGFSSTGIAASQRVAIVNETMGRLAWPGEDPLGKCIRLSGETSCYAVSGVSHDMRRGSVVEDPTMEIYVPLGASLDSLRPSAITALLIRVSGDTKREIPLVEQEMRNTDPSLPYARVESLEDMLGPSIRPWRLGTTMFSLFGGLGLLLSAVGVYGIVAHYVAMRTNELAVRIALGADTGRVLRLVIGQALRSSAMGIAIGIAGGVAAGRALASLIYRVSPLQPLAYVAAAAVLLGVSALGAYLPARRAARTDPTASLHAE